MKRYRRSAAAAGLLLLLLVPAAIAEEWRRMDRPPFQILYQEGNQAEATALAREAPGVLAALQDDLGIRANGPFTIRILPAHKDTPSGKGEIAPHWAVGYVRSGSGEVALRGEWVRSYPFGDLLSLFGHEMTHLLLDTLPASDTLPRWFHEGVAVRESRHWSLRDVLALGTLVLVGRPTPLGALTRSFPADAAAARAAYAESFHFVGYLEREHGPGAVRRLLEKMSSGASFHEAFRLAMGRGLPAEEGVWRSRVNWAYRWIPALTSTGVLWMGITMLVLLGRVARMRRDRALRDSWKDQGLD